MPEILSQQEIDSLLSGIPLETVDTKVAAEEKPAGPEIMTFDFRLPNRLSKNQLRTLQAVHESFGETFSSYLISRLQTNVNISVSSVDQIFYSEYVLSVPSPSCLYIVRIMESDAFAIIELSPQLVLAMVSRLLGGQTEQEKKSRLITRIEQRIAKGIVQRGIVDLQKAWKAIADLNFQFERYETEGDFAQIVPLSEIVLVVSLELTFGEQKYLMNLCFPTFALEPILAKLNLQNIGTLSVNKTDAEWTNILKRQVTSTGIELVGLLGTTNLTLRELVELKQGDVIRTSIGENVEAQVQIGNKTRFWGRAGVNDGRLALKITHTIADTPSKQ
ncbi:MAG TPA: flagellar motor switch protein FliM [Bacteroidota bacterium]|nr:flagellar motor switch protein FliM [Bacteroidota bacterium]